MGHPSLMEPWIDEIHRLTDSLSDQHDRIGKPECPRRRFSPTGTG